MIQVLLTIFTIIAIVLLVILNGFIAAKLRDLKKIQTNIKEHKQQRELELQWLNDVCKEQTTAIKQLQQEHNVWVHNLSQGADRFVETLEHQYQDAENEYQNKIQNLETDYEQMIEEKQKIEQELVSIRKTLHGANAARIREKKLQEEEDFYKLSVTPEDEADIIMLETVKRQLRQPRALSMTIWTTYWRKPLKTLCNNILGTSTVCGIYKLTDRTTGEVYIGQARDVAKRFADHAKCGLGIDTPQGNKLYQAMMRDKLQNFTWELLERCEPSELNDKEKYYIDLYDSYNFGLNSTRGNNQ